MEQPNAAFDYRKMNVHGPFDLIGDVHGCADELQALLKRLGYGVIENRPGQTLNSGPVYVHPHGRRAIFLGDLVDRGPRILDTLRLVYNMIQHGSAFSVMGNHDDKLMRKLDGRNVQVTHGLENTMAQLDALPRSVKPQFEKGLRAFLKSLGHYYILDGGRLVVAHAGIEQALQGKGGDKVRAFTLYGKTTGRKDEYGLPERLDWAAQYRGEAMVVYGHTPVPEAVWVNNTINIDTGCVFGGSLTALRYPEKELVAIPARQVYRESLRPFPRATV